MDQQYGAKQTTTDRPMSREEAAEEHFKVALEAIEEAQAFVDLAAQALCPLKGMAREWKAVGALYDRVKKTWHEVSARGGRLRARGGLELDHDPRPDEMRRLERLWSRG